MKKLFKVGNKDSWATFFKSLYMILNIFYMFQKFVCTLFTEVFTWSLSYK